MTYCAVSVTIVSGAVAERVRVSTYLIIVAVQTLIIYPFPAHWLFSEAGFLSSSNSFGGLVGTGVFDFAAACTIHVV
jgi:Amt family ammonium transporter